MQTELERATALLDGLVETDTRGRLRLRYLQEGSPAELDGRRALASLLRSDDGLNPQLRKSLAELFEPEPRAEQQRKLAFAFRRRGKMTDPYANAHIFVEVFEAVSAGSKTTEAIAAVAEKYDISDDLVKRLWRKYRRKFPVAPRRR